MRKILLLLLAVVLVWVVVKREQIFVRDVRASVYRNNVKQDGIEVYINPSNDILLEQFAGNTVRSSIILQNWDRMPATPAHIECVRWMVCLTDAAHASTLPLVPPDKTAYDPHVLMQGRLIIFTDPDGAQVKVTL